MTDAAGHGAKRAASAASAVAGRLERAERILETIATTGRSGIGAVTLSPSDCEAVAVWVEANIMREAAPNLAVRDRRELRPWDWSARAPWLRAHLDRFRAEWQRRGEDAAARAGAMAGRWADSAGARRSLEMAFEGGRVDLGEATVGPPDGITESERREAWLVGFNRQAEAMLAAHDIAMRGP